MSYSPRAKRTATNKRTQMTSTALSNQERKRRARRQAQMRQRMPLFITLGVVVVVILIFVAIAHVGGGGPSPQSPASAQVVHEVTNIPTSVLKTVGTGGVSEPLQAIAGTPPILTTSAGKPEFIYIGAGWCPFCAAERWSMIVALSRFGTISGLEQTISSPTDSAGPSTNTLSFETATYTSKYLDAVLVELENTNNTPIATPAPDVSALMSKYDAPPYVPAGQSGGIPFIDIGNQYLQISAGYSPLLLQGISWNQIAAGLSDPSNDVTRAIVGNANYLTAGICKMTKQQPASVCGADPVVSIAKTLP